MLGRFHTMPDNRKVIVLVAVSICAAVVTYIALRSALWSTPPWSMAQPYSPPHTEADYPSSFVEGRAQLFMWSAPLLCLSSALAGWFLVRSFYPGGPKLSRSAALSVAWPAVAFPLVGYFGLYAIVFAGVGIVAALIVVVQVALGRIRGGDLWILLPNSVWCILLYVFSLASDGVYGD